MLLQNLLIFSKIVALLTFLHGPKLSDRSRKLWLFPSNAEITFSYASEKHRYISVTHTDFRS